MRFTIIDILSGVNGYTVYYSRENGAAVVDTVVVDTSGKGVQVHVHYRAAQPDSAADLTKAADR